MSYLLNNQQNMNDIIFADRNKNYGAYVLRSNYTATLLRSIFLVCTGFVSLFSFALHLNRSNAEDTQVRIIPPDSIIRVIPFHPADPIRPITKTKPDAPPEGKRDAALNNMTRVIDSLNVSENAFVATETGDTSSTGVKDDPALSGNGNSTFSLTPKNNENRVRNDYEVDTGPEFEGGLAALYKYLRFELRYPAEAYEAGVEAILQVKFVINEKGKVCSLQVMNKAGFGLDEEALRVVAKIPDFKTPAMAGGKPVKVYCQLPIRFLIK
jgi:periplasmic protein TonB